MGQVQASSMWHCEETNFWDWLVWINRRHHSRLCIPQLIPQRPVPVKNLSNRLKTSQEKTTRIKNKHFIHEINTIAYDVSNVNLFLRKTNEIHAANLDKCIVPMK